MRSYKRKRRIWKWDWKARDGIRTNTASWKQDRWGYKKSQRA
jgi:hypothetical protein